MLSNVLVHVSLVLLLIHSACNIAVNSIKVYTSQVLNLGGEEINNIN